MMNLTCYVKNRLTTALRTSPSSRACPGQPALKKYGLGRDGIWRYETLCESSASLGSQGADRKAPDRASPLAVAGVGSPLGNSLAVVGSGPVSPTNQFAQTAPRSQRWRPSRASSKKTRVGPWSRCSHRQSPIADLGSATRYRDAQPFPTKRSAEKKPKFIDDRQNPDMNASLASVQTAHS